MTVKLNDAEIRDALKEAMDEGQDYGDDGKPLPEKRVALEAQRKMFREIEKQAKFNISAISQLDLFESPMWKSIKEELGIK